MNPTNNTCHNLIEEVFNCLIKIESLISKIACGNNINKIMYEQVKITVGIVAGLNDIGL